MEIGRIQENGATIIEHPPPLEAAVHHKRSRSSLGGGGGDYSAGTGRVSTTHLSKARALLFVVDDRSVGGGEGALLFGHCSC